jgi:hypothetical protein
MPSSSSSSLALQRNSGLGLPFWGFLAITFPILTYGSETWTVCTSDRSRIAVNEMKFLRTTGYTKLDKKRNTEILRELKINSVPEHVDQYRNNW